MPLPRWGCRRKRSRLGVSRLDTLRVLDGFLDHLERLSLDRLCDHFLHALEVMGPDHVGVGSDFDGTEGLLRPIPEDAAAVPVLFEALTRRGVDAATLPKIANENFLRLLNHC